MEDQQTLASLLHWYHAAIALGGLLSIFAVIHRLWIAPEQARRKKVEDRLADLDKWRVGVDRDLERGSDKFAEMTTQIRELRNEMKSHEEAQRKRHEQVIQWMAAIDTRLKMTGGLPDQ